MTRHEVTLTIEVEVGKDQLDPADVDWAQVLDGHIAPGSLVIIDDIVDLGDQ